MTTTTHKVFHVLAALASAHKSCWHESRGNTDKAAMFLCRASDYMRAAMRGDGSWAPPPTPTRWVTDDTRLTPARTAAPLGSPLFCARSAVKDALRYVVVARGGRYPVAMLNIWDTTLRQAGPVFNVWVQGVAVKVTIDGDVFTLSPETPPGGCRGLVARGVYGPSPAESGMAGCGAASRRACEVTCQVCGARVALDTTDPHDPVVVLHRRSNRDLGVTGDRPCTGSGMIGHETHETRVRAAIDQHEGGLPRPRDPRDPETPAAATEFWDPAGTRHRVWAVGPGVWVEVPPGVRDPGEPTRQRLLAAATMKDAYRVAREVMARVARDCGVSVDLGRMRLTCEYGNVDVTERGRQLGHIGQDLQWTPLGDGAQLAERVAYLTPST